MRRLKLSEILKVTEGLLRIQKGLCPLCETRVQRKKGNICLDHNHRTGAIRSTLCRNCNGIEGKIFNLANRAKRHRTPEEWLVSLLDYWRRHEADPLPLLHPTHRTEGERRIKRNARAKAARARRKA